MNALCSAFHELKEITFFALGINNDWEMIRKENMRWHKKETFDAAVQDWVENCLLPVLPHLKY